MHVISTLEQVTPSWLTRVLQRHQLLPRGEVTAVAMQANPAFNSVIVHLLLTFSSPVPAWAPGRLLLKCNRKEAWAIQAGMREAAFYQMIATLPQHPSVIVQCYDAAVDLTTGDSHVLLHDLSATHVTPVTRDQQLTPNQNLPAAEHLNQAIDALARLHAFWWESPYLGTGCAQIGAWCHDVTNFTDEIARRRRAWDQLRARECDWFPSRLATIYETILTNCSCCGRPIPNHGSPAIAT